MDTRDCHRQPLDAGSAFACLPVAHGIIAAALEYIAQQDHLHITREDLLRISKHSSATWDNTMATTRECSAALHRWAGSENMVLPSSVEALETGSPPLQPWEEGLPWSNSPWSLATRIVSKFVSKDKPPVEGLFLDELADIARTAFSLEKTGFYHLSAKP